MADEDGERFGSDILNAPLKQKKKEKKKKNQKAACPVTKHELYVVSHS